MADLDLQLSDVLLSVDDIDFDYDHYDDDDFSNEEDIDIDPEADLHDPATPPPNPLPHAISPSPSDLDSEPPARRLSIDSDLDLDERSRNGSIDDSAEDSVDINSDLDEDDRFGAAPDELRLPDHIFNVLQDLPLGLNDFDLDDPDDFEPPEEEDVESEGLFVDDFDEGADQDFDDHNIVDQFPVPFGLPPFRHFNRNSPIFQFNLPPLPPANPSRRHIASPPRPNGRMDRAGNVQGSGRDQLVGMDFAQRSASAGRSRRSSRPGNQAPQGPQLRARNQPPRPPLEVIDLTGDDGDAVGSASQSQNARRQHSQRLDNAPRLNRSDGSYVGNRHPVIELSSDSDQDDDVVVMSHNDVQHGMNRALGGRRPFEEDLAVLQRDLRASEQALTELEQAARSLQPPPHRHHHHHPNHHHHHHERPNPMDAGPFTNFGGFFGAAFGHLGQMRQMRIFGAINDDIQEIPRPPDANPAVPNILNYHPPFAERGPQKPQHEPPPKSADGFTRDTGEDKIIICPSCEEELAYDPDEERPTKRARTKKDNAEHHFWAVKACGHVYCRRCYDNRKPTGKNPPFVGFRQNPQDQKKIVCAVDGCDTEVGTKTAWVGLFL